MPPVRRTKKKDDPVYQDCSDSDEDHPKKPHRKSFNKNTFHENLNPLSRVLSPRKTLSPRNDIPTPNYNVASLFPKPKGASKATDHFSTCDGKPICLPGPDYSKIQQGEKCTLMQNKYFWEAASHLESYYRKNGHINVPEGATFEGYGLGSFLADTRARMRRNELHQDRKDYLLAFNQRPNAKEGAFIENRREDLENRREDSWTNSLNELSEFYQNNGHFKVPKTKQTMKLYMWITGQKSVFLHPTKGGGPNQLLGDRVEKLRDIGYPVENWMT